MSLKYKKQHETRRNINQTHNPKVAGSNPAPATKSPQQLARIAFLPHRPTSTLISTFRSDSDSGVSFASRRSQRAPVVVTSVYAGTECTSMRKERSGGTPCFWCAQRSFRIDVH